MLSTYSKKRAKIIWVDDEIDILKSHVLFLEKKGYSVLGVHSAEEALDILKKDVFDIDLTKDLTLSSSSKYEGFLYSMLQVFTIIKDLKSSLTFLLLYVAQLCTYK